MEEDPPPTHSQPPSQSTSESGDRKENRSPLLECHNPPRRRIGASSLLNAISLGDADAIQKISDAGKGYYDTE